LDWCEESFEARLAVTTGIMPVRQSPGPLKAIRDAITGYEDLPMTALHEFTAASGSVVIGLAVAEGRISAEDGVVAAQLDEIFQIERNGEDEEAMERLANMRGDVLVAAEFLKLCRAWN
jgi:chaperone required for assembly of F1-ATPase